MGQICILQYGILERGESGQRRRVLEIVVLWQFVPLGLVNGPSRYISPWEDFSSVTAVGLEVKKEKDQVGGGR